MTSVLPPTETAADIAANNAKFLTIQDASKGYHQFSLGAES